MNLELNEEQKLLQRTVREFAENEVKPLAREIDETGHFPRETFRKAAQRVTDETGKVTNWALEMGGSSALIRAGWGPNTTKVGDVLTVEDDFLV